MPPLTLTLFIYLVAGCYILFSIYYRATVLAQWPHDDCNACCTTQFFWAPMLNISSVQLCTGNWILINLLKAKWKLTHHLMDYFPFKLYTTKEFNWHYTHSPIVAGPWWYWFTMSKILWVLPTTWNTFNTHIYEAMISGFRLMKVLIYWVLSEKSAWENMLSKCS